MSTEVQNNDNSNLNNSAEENTSTVKTDIEKESEQLADVNVDALEIDLKKYKEAMSIIIDEFNRVGDPTKKEKVKDFIDSKKSDDFISNFKTMIIICQQLMHNNQALL